MNPLTLATLRLMGDGAFHSGEEVAAALGVTRATIWNAVREAGELGIEVESVRGRGYRLDDPPVWLDAAAVAKLLGPRARRFHVEVVEHVDSTNSALLKRAEAGGAPGTVLAAELQSAGRGRRGRSWASGLGGALTFSLLWRFEQGAAALTGLSLVVGIAVARALASLGAADVRLKWPNDILHQGRKLGGILIEVRGDALGPTAAVIGIGLNVRMPPALEARIDQPVTDAVQAGAGGDRNRLLAAVLQELAELLDAFARDGFAPLEPEYRRWHALQDAPVLVNLGDGKPVRGHARGTADDGALIVETSEGVRRFHGGEVSLRAVSGEG
ncbi:MAG: biotin--[acetyl-CoA-carboxylase] ligase [Burkholderiales bacterium]|nr:biotin--[acetyl-CoA-carboxylase] ligase [Burkholderiales bacterium]